MGPAGAAPADGELWVARFDGPGHGHDQPAAIATSPDGSIVYVTGYATSGSTAEDYVTFAYGASNGGTLWYERYNGRANGTDEATAIAVSPDGSRVFVTGYADQGASGIDYVTIAYEAVTGARLWLKRFNGRGNDRDYAQALGVSPDGSTVYVTGYSDGGAVGYDFATIAYDAATGNARWLARFNGSLNTSDEAFALLLSPDGSTLFVGGQTYDQTNYYGDYATVAYDTATGSQLWLSEYAGPAGAYGQDAVLAMGVSPDGSRVFVTGYSDGGTGYFYDYATIAYDSETGAQVWLARYSGPEFGTDWANDLGVSPDGSRVFVTGYSYGGGLYVDDYATVAYDASNGAQVWVSRLGGRKEDRAFDLAVRPDGSALYVTGYSQGIPGNFDYATETYDAATGANLGERRYNNYGTSEDDGDAVAVSPDGSKVFVTGHSEGTPGNFDIATVAYQAT